MVKKTQLHGRMMRHICFSGVYLLTHFRKIKLLKTLTIQTGAISLNFYQPEIKLSVLKGGYSYRNLEETSFNGLRKTIKP